MTSPAKPIRDLTNAQAYGRDAAHSANVIATKLEEMAAYLRLIAGQMELADFDYDSGFGAAEIAQDLRIVFADGQQMWRGEYDGSEWWEYSTPAVIPDESHPIRSLGGAEVMWERLADLNDAKAS